MASINPRNNGNLTGRLADDVRVFTNKDGSRKVVFTLITERDYLDKNGERPIDPIAVEQFIRADAKGLGPFALIHKGDQVQLNTSIRVDRFTNKNGEIEYVQKNEINAIILLDSKKISQERLANRLKTVQAENAALNAQAVQATEADTAPVA